MLTALISINITLSTLFLMMKHPLSTGAILLMQTMTICMTTAFLNQNAWFSYILFLIMVGGMLILFMYMTSIASNEKFKTNPMYMLMTLIPLTLSTLTLDLTETIKNNESLNLEKETSFMTTINKFINFPMSMIMAFMMIYLLLALIATVKITNFKQGSIRQMN